MPQPLEPSTDAQRSWPLCAALAMTAPALLAFNLPPSATFFNQAAALIGWGGFLVVVADGASARRRVGTVSRPRPHRPWCHESAPWRAQFLCLTMR